MEQTEYLYSGNKWFKDQLHGCDGPLWIKARKMFLFNCDLGSTLNLFKFDYRAIKEIKTAEGTVLIGSKNTTLDSNKSTEHRAGASWADDAKSSIRRLLDEIVTRWNPRFLDLQRIRPERLHKFLISTPLSCVPNSYDTPHHENENFDAKRALEKYQNCLTPLHYHELWHEIVHDYKNVDTKLSDRQTTLDIDLYFDSLTLDEEHQTSLIFGRNHVTYIDNYNALTNKLGLFDIALITIGGTKYFAMVVHVEQRKVKPQDEKNKTREDNKDLKFEIYTVLGLYSSRKCADAVKNFHQTNSNKILPIIKLSNITSSRRMISAINNLSEFSQYPSLIKPTANDPYYQIPEDYDESNDVPLNSFNLAQSRAIQIAECMFDDIQERIHLVHGPPGTGKSRTIAGIVLKLISRMCETTKKEKILLCAPSNNACDELCRRILSELKRCEIPYRDDILVRVGCQPPDDFHLCGHFLDFMIMKSLVNTLKSNAYYDETNIVRKTELTIMKNAKVVVSTLNYCGSTRMNYLKSKTGFIIVDEASQSLEADSLLPLRFQCRKIMLVGDPMQLPPCVLSQAGKQYGLNQSLYKRLFSIFEDEECKPITMLDTQYRMHPEICHFPSKWFYNGNLITDESLLKKMRKFPLKPLYLYNLKNSSQLVDEAGSSSNRDEAAFIQKFCVKLVEYLVKLRYSELDDSDTYSSCDTDSSDDENGDNEDSDNYSLADKQRSESMSLFENEDNTSSVSSIANCSTNNDELSISIQQRIAVITPYRAQVRELRSRLPNCIEVMTIDSSQGKEKDIVIISCVRNGNSIGFLEDMNRVNVMLTRSKVALYVVGNLDKLSNQNESWRAFVNHAREHKIIEDVGINGSEIYLPYRRLQNKRLK